MASTALVSSYNDNIRPLLDAVDRLRHLKVTEEGIQLPTIVVVGDQSSGKSSVLESLAGISLPRGQGICTRVPLIMRLQHDPKGATQASLHLEYSNKTVSTTEATITDDINEATVEIAGAGKGISDAPITLVVKKKGVPDLTLVDLPGITRVPVQGQPENIYEEITKIIMGYIAPKESIILNVLSATVDFPTCESIRMSQKVDHLGGRTLAVVTKSDKAPEGLLEKVTVDDVRIGLGYVCVRNRVGDETYEEARAEEERLFKSHPLLSQIDKSMTGIPVLAERLTTIQALIIAKCLPDIVKKIDEKLNRSMSELSDMPQRLSTDADALKAIMHIFKLLRESLEKSLVTGEYDEYPDEKSLHGAARIFEMLQNYSKNLPDNCPTTDEPFLMEEVRVLEEAKGIWLPNFLPRSSFLALLKRKVSAISHTPHELINAVWEYVEKLTIQIMLRHLQNYPQMQSSSQRVVQNLINKFSAKSHKFVKNMIEMELCSHYTSSPDYMTRWFELMKEQKKFMEVIEKHSKPTEIHLEAFGEVEVGHLRSHADMAEQAFDVKMRLTAYWKSVVLRLVDSVALHILHSIKGLVESELEAALVNELVGPKMAGVERMMQESPGTAAKRDRLKKSVELLRQSKDVVANIMDRIAAGANLGPAEPMHVNGLAQKRIGASTAFVHKLKRPGKRNTPQSPGSPLSLVKRKKKKESTGDLVDMCASERKNESDFS